MIFFHHSKILQVIFFELVFAIGTGWNVTNFNLGWPNLSSFERASIAKRWLFSQLFLFVCLCRQKMIILR